MEDFLLSFSELTASEESEGVAPWASHGSSKGPWFLFITPRSEEDDRHDPGTVVALRIHPSNELPAEIHRMPVPKTFRRCRLLNPLPRAGGGHYLLIDDHCKPRATIHIVDPFSSSWTSLCRLRGGVLYSQTAQSFLKVVTRDGGIVPGTPVLAIAQPHRHLVWMTLGAPYHWRSLNDLLGARLQRWFSDVIWCRRSNSFLALRPDIKKVIYFDLGETVKIREMTLDLTPGFYTNADERDGWVYFMNALCVDAPSALFVVRWEKLTKKGEEARRRLEVHKLLDVNGAEKRWERVTSLDNCSFFLGSNNSVALSAADFPGLRSNRIYLPFNGRYPKHDHREDFGFNLDLNDLPVNWIYDLDSQSWESCNGSEDAWMVPFYRCPLQLAWVMPPTMNGKAILPAPKGTRSLPEQVHENREISSSVVPMLKADSVH